MAKPITAARLRELLCYDPATGEFMWRVRRGNLRAGTPAGAPHSMGYIQLQVDGINCLAHRLAWLYMTGAWPTQDVDHIDGDKKNNRFSNLRDVPHQVNNQNVQRANKNNQSCGLLGVARNKQRWIARIAVGAKTHNLGTHDTPEQAHAAYLEAKRRLHVGNTL